MEPKYGIGQKVIIQPLSEPGPTQRENDIQRFSGQIGEVRDFYWIDPPTGQLFYIYNVIVGKEKNEIVVYEDEMEPCLS
jgi:hypothetical protein